MKLIVRSGGLQDYESVWQQMKTFTESRGSCTTDECWLLEHHPVFTLGQAGKPAHILMASDIPLVKSDRGGQVTYHGPGQLIAYLLLDVRRHNINVRALVAGLEESIIDLLQTYAIKARAKKEAPGVYVDGKKIAALGLRIRRGCSYHGLSLNIAMDTRPFTYIDPCGYPGLEVVQLRQLGVTDSLAVIGEKLVHHIAHTFGYDSVAFSTDIRAVH